VKPYYETELGKLYHGDCLEIMPMLEPVDLVLTDPPYDPKTHNGAILDIPIDFEPINNINKMVSLFLSLSKRWVISFCPLELLGEYKFASGECWVRAGIWDRIINMPQISGDRPAQACEGIAIMHPVGKKIWNGGGKAGIWRHRVERGFKKHPTQKPMTLFSELLLNFAKDNETILDPFFGSGTTGIVCEEFSLKWIGIEIEEKYCEIAAKRIEKERSQLKLWS